MMDFFGDILFSVGFISVPISIIFLINSFFKKTGYTKKIGKALMFSVLLMILGLELNGAYSIRSFFGSVFSMIGSIIITIFVPLTIYYLIRKREKAKKAGLVLLASFFIVFAGNIVDDTPQSVKDLRAAEVAERKALKDAKKAEELAEKEADELAIKKAEELEAKKARYLEKNEAAELDAKKVKELTEQKKKEVINSTYDNSFGKNPLKTSKDQQNDAFEKRLKKLEEYFIFTVSLEEKDRECVIGTIKDGNGKFLYISKIDQEAKEYMFAAGIQTGTIIYDNYYRYTVDDNIRLEYLFNDTNTTKLEVEEEIKQMLAKSDTNIKELREIMGKFYEKNK